jgi:hypothetical protein
MRADQPTYSSQDVRELMPAALGGEWRSEVAPALLTAIKRAFAFKNNSLKFPDIAIQQLEAARHLAAGSVFGSNALSWAIQLVQEGRTDANAVYDVVGLAAKERGYAHFRQIEEHYLRESIERRADGVRARLEGAISGLSVTELGAMIIDRPAARRGSKKKSNIDDGVAF